jgi:signal transduction histidine kinase
MVLAGRTRAWLYVGCVALLGAITWIDYVTGYELGLFIFYFVPVGLAAWYGSRAAGIAFALASAGCWFGADRLALHPYSNALLIYWETFMRLVSYFTTALTLSNIRGHIRQREDLLHVVSHDLRAPLAALVGQARILRRRAADDAWTIARADAILRAASRMDAMVEDLVDAARFESGGLRLVLEMVDLREYLGELLGRMGASLEVERVLVSLPGSDRITVQVDPRRLERVLLNLLSNALKYAPEGTVRLEVERLGGWVVISVIDDGPGIDASDVGNLFTRYYRGRRTPSPDGVGLGLSGARLLVEAHGGRISVESTPGAGATFRVELPAAAPAQAG